MCAKALLGSVIIKSELHIVRIAHRSVDLFGGSAQRSLAPPPRIPTMVRDFRFKGTFFPNTDDGRVRLEDAILLKNGGMVRPYQIQGQSGVLLMNENFEHYTHGECRLIWKLGDVDGGEVTGGHPNLHTKAVGVGGDDGSGGADDGTDGKGKGSFVDPKGSGKGPEGQPNVINNFGGKGMENQENAWLLGELLGPMVRIMPFREQLELQFQTGVDPAIRRIPGRRDPT